MSNQESSHGLRPEDFLPPQETTREELHGCIETLRQYASHATGDTISSTLQRSGQPDVEAYVTCRSSTDPNGLIKPAGFTVVKNGRSDGHGFLLEIADPQLRAWWQEVYEVSLASERGSVVQQDNRVLAPRLQGLVQGAPIGSMLRHLDRESFSVQRRVSEGLPGLSLSLQTESEGPVGADGLSASKSQATFLEVVSAAGRIYLYNNDGNGNESLAVTDDESEAFTYKLKGAFDGLGYGDSVAATPLEDMQALTEGKLSAMNAQLRIVVAKYT